MDFGEHRFYIRELEPTILAGGDSEYRKRLTDYGIQYGIPDEILNYFLNANDGRKFFLKEIANHSFRPELDLTFSQLVKVKSDHFKLLLPLAHADEKFLFRAANSHFHLFQKEELNYFQPSKMPFSELLDALEEMHRKIATYQFSGQSFRTFQSWIERPLKKLKEKFGSDIPFVPQFEGLMASRYSYLDLAKGNIHWDIHERNVCFDENGKLTILDWDLMLDGEYACDFTRAACIYASEDGNQFSLAPEIVTATTKKLKRCPLKLVNAMYDFLFAERPWAPCNLLIISATGAKQ